MNKISSIVLVSVLISTYQHGFSQEGIEQEKPTGEFSINITETITRFSRNPLTANDMRDNFMLMYKSPNVGNTFAYRIGLNADYHNDKDGTNSFINRLETTQLFLSLGFEKRKSINKNFSYHFGIDGFFFLLKEKIETQNQGFPTPQSFIIESNSFHLGLAPLFGLSWNISKKVRIFTESYMRAAYTFRLRESTSSGNLPINNELERSEGSYLKLLMPTNIHFSISL